MISSANAPTSALLESVPPPAPPSRVEDDRPRFDESLKSHSVEPRNEASAALEPVQSEQPWAGDAEPKEEQPAEGSDESIESSDGTEQTGTPVIATEAGRRAETKPTSDGTAQPSRALEVESESDLPQPKPSNERGAPKAAVENAAVNAGSDEQQPSDASTLSATGTLESEDGAVREAAVTQPAHANSSVENVAPVAPRPQPRTGSDADTSARSTEVSTPTSSTSRVVAETSAGRGAGEHGAREFTSDGSTRAPEAPVAPTKTESEAIFQMERIADAGSVKPETSAGLTTSVREARLATPGPTNAHGADGRLVAQSVGRGLSAALQQGSGDVLIRLSPPSLGLVRVQMTLDHGAVSVRLETTTQAAQQILGDQLGALRNSLEARGLSVERLGVQHAPPASSNQGAQQQSTSQQQQGSADSQQDLGGEHDAGGAPSHGRQDGDADRDASATPRDQSDIRAESGFTDLINLQLEAIA